MRENPDLTAFLTLDLKTWVDKKILYEDININLNENPKELFVVISRVLVGTHTKVRDPVNKELPYY